MPSDQSDIESQLVSRSETYLCVREPRLDDDGCWGVRYRPVTADDITDEMVERGAKAIWNADAANVSTWEEYIASMPGRGNTYRRDARLALEAAFLEQTGES